LRLESLAILYIYYNGEREGYRGKKVEGVGGMKDKELKLEEIEASHTLGQPILVVYLQPNKKRRDPGG
jgi:hypothetical protein